MQDLMIELSEARKQLNNSLEDYKKIGRTLAQAEMEYKIALRKEILRLKLESKVAWTACSELAKGDENVANLRFDRDVKSSEYNCAFEKINATKIELRILENEVEAMRRGV